MGLRAIVTLVLAVTASAALAQTSLGSPPGQAPLAPSAINPIPPSPADANGRAPLPKIVQPKPSRRANRKPRGQPIVRGNTDIFVDSYGQLSTTIQP